MQKHMQEISRKQSIGKVIKSIIHYHRDRIDIIFNDNSFLMIKSSGEINTERFEDLQPPSTAKEIWELEWETKLLTPEKAINPGEDTPIKLKDGHIGIVTRWVLPEELDTQKELGIQVFGEKDTRWIPLSKIIIKSNNTLIEI